MAHPYIGVTGFMHSAEVRAALEVFPDCGRKLMVGVLMSTKTLHGIPNKYPFRYPQPRDIGGIFLPDIRALNLIHFASDSSMSLYSDLMEAREYGLPHLHGFQVNITWPDPIVLMRVRAAGMRMVMQINRSMMESVDYNPDSLARRLDAYRDAATDILVDASGGLGQAIDTPTAGLFLKSIKERHPDFSLGVAGGLSAETVGSISDLIQAYPATSIDAEGRLRSGQHDHLDLEKMFAYLQSAGDMISRHN